MARLKSLFLLFTALFQGIGIIFLFISIKWAILFFISYGISVVILFSLFIKERLKEKKEEEENDYRDY